MNAKRLLTILCAIPLSALSFPVAAFQYSGNVNVAAYTPFGDQSNSSDIVFPGEYQPRGEQGLTAASAQSAISAYGAHATAKGAVYGTDLSRSAASQSDPNLIASGLGVEPMADVELDSSFGTYADGYGEWNTYASAGAGLLASVQHRVILDPAITIPGSILGDVQSQLNSIPLEVQWAYAVTGGGNSNPTADISVSVDSPTGNCTSTVNGQCGGIDLMGLLPGSTDSGSISFAAVASTDTLDAIYGITLAVNASTNTGPGEATFGSLQAIVDPYLVVDPNWEYAPYFLVQQESILDGGSWVGITRDYLAPVPIPGAFWFFSSALLGLVGIGRPRSLS